MHCLYKRFQKSCFHRAVGAVDVFYNYNKYLNRPNIKKVLGQAGTK